MKDIASKQRAPVKADTVICNTLESDLIRKGTQISSLSPCKSILPLCSSTFGQCLTMPCFSFCSCCFSPSVQMLLPSFSSKNHSPWHQNSLSLLSPWAVLAPYSYWSLPKLWIYRRSRKCQTGVKYLSRDLWQGQLKDSVAILEYQSLCAVVPGCHTYTMVSAIHVFETHTRQVYDERSCW